MFRVCWGLQLYQNVRNWRNENIFKMICNVQCFVENLIRWGQPVNVKKCYLPSRGRMQTWPPTHQLQEINLKFVGHLPQDKEQLPNILSQFVSPALFQWISSIKASPIVYSLENNKLNLIGLFVCHLVNSLQLRLVSSTACILHSCKLLLQLLQKKRKEVSCGAVRREYILKLSFLSPKISTWHMEYSAGGSAGTGLLFFHNCHWNAWHLTC